MNNAGLFKRQVKRTMPKKVSRQKKSSRNLLKKHWKN